VERCQLLLGNPQQPGEDGVVSAPSGGLGTGSIGEYEEKRTG